MSVQTDTPFVTNKRHSPERDEVIAGSDVPVSVSTPQTEQKLTVPTEKTEVVPVKQDSGSYDDMRALVQQSMIEKRIPMDPKVFEQLKILHGVYQQRILNVIQSKGFSVRKRTEFLNQGQRCKNSVVDSYIMSCAYPSQTPMVNDSRIKEIRNYAQRYREQVYALQDTHGADFQLVILMIEEIGKWELAAYRCLR